jgi:hypothetical protein
MGLCGFYGLKALNPRRSRRMIWNQPVSQASPLLA